LENQATIKQGLPAHQLGGGGMTQRGPIAILRRLLGSNEMFMRAVPIAKKGLREKDLFEGVG